MNRIEFLVLSEGCVYLKRDEFGRLELPYVNLLEGSLLKNLIIKESKKFRGRGPTLFLNNNGITYAIKLDSGYPLLSAYMLPFGYVKVAISNLEGAALDLFNSFRSDEFREIDSVPIESKNQSH